MNRRPLVPALLCCVLFSSPAWALFDDKFEIELAKEIEAIKMARDTQVGGYELLTVAELKRMIDEGKPMVLVDTCLLYTSRCV